MTPLPGNLAHTPILHTQSNSTFVISSNYFSLHRMNVPVGDPRVQRLQPATVNVVEAAHAVKNIL